MYDGAWCMYDGYIEKTKESHSHFEAPLNSSNDAMTFCMWLNECQWNSINFEILSDELGR